MTNADDSRLQRLLGTAELAIVRDRLRRHFERAEPGASTTSLRIAGLDAAAHAALCQLTGRPASTARSMLLDVADLDAQLRASGLADSLRDALEQLEGPIEAKTSLRRALQARWSALVARDRGDARLLSWLRSSVALTLLKRLGRDPDQAESLLAEADAILGRLPAGGLTRSQLAAEVLGDAHGLDNGRPVATLLLAVWRQHETGQVRIDDNGRPRDVWARAGVLVNELARPALFLNLPSAASGEDTGIPGEPAYLSLRQLLRRSRAWRVAERRVFVCENPNVVAIAADTLGAACAPLVCTDGMPAAAQRTLLDQLAAAGARLRYHGDYDWAGIAIGNLVMRTWNAVPWRFCTAEYLSAVGRRSTARDHGLGPAAVEAAWDPELRHAMLELNLAISEEAVVEAMLGDLRYSG